MTMSNHEISVAADKAADYLEKHGLVKGMLTDVVCKTGRVCLRGAILLGNGSSLSSMQDFEVTALVADYLELPDYEWGRYPRISAAVRWNNQPERTQEEVVEVLRNVAIKYRNDEMTVNGDSNL